MSLANIISCLESKRDAIERKLGNVDPMAAHFTHGPGCGNPATRKKHYASMDRLAIDSGELIKVKADLAFYTSRQKSVEAGECHENGQRRTDAPSRVKVRNAEQLYGDWLRATLVLPCNVELACNGSITTLIKINKRKCATAGDDTPGGSWDFCDIIPLKPDGTKYADFREATKMASAWIKLKKAS